MAQPVKWTVLCGLLLAAAGCTPAPAPDRSAEPAPSVADAPSEAPPGAVEQRRRLIPAALRQAAPHQSTGDAEFDGIKIDLMSAVAAPTVDEAPVGRGMLLVQLNLFSEDPNYADIRPGHPYLMTPAGSWRQFDLQRYGFEAAAYGELSSALSSDGQHVAFADPSGLAVVDLRDNTFHRFELPVRHAVALEWTSDGSNLLLKDRSSGRRPCGPRGCALNLSTGEIKVLPYDLFYAAQGDRGQAFEVEGASKTRSAHVITHQPGAAATRADLEYRTSPYSAGGPVAAKRLAFAQCSDARRTRDAGGLVVVEPATGAFVGMLSNERARGCHLSAQAWLSDRHLLVSDWLSGAMWLWDPISKHISQVASSQGTGLIVSVASEVLVERLRPILRP